jgi:hypothetical protein
MNKLEFGRLKNEVMALGRTFATINPTAVTLTCKKCFRNSEGVAYIDPLRASRNLVHFRNKLNQKIGCRRRQIGFFAVTEKDASGRYHHHLCIERPSHVDECEFKNLIWQVWRSTDWGMRIIDVQDRAGPEWISYMCKLRSKDIWDEAIDWANCQHSRLAKSQ